MNDEKQTDEPVSLEGPAQPPQPGTDSADPTSKTRLKVRSTKRLRHKLIGIGVLLCIVLCATAAYAYGMSPRTAPARYLDRITRAQSWQHSGQITIKSQINEVVQDTNLNFTGAYETADNNVPEYQFDISGQVDYAGAGREIAGTIVITQGSTHTRLTKPTILDTLLPGALNQWFKLDQLKCSQPDLERIQAVYEEDILKKLPFSNQKRLNLFPHKQDGHNVTRYTGDIDMQQLGEIVQAATAKLETVCGQTADDTAHETNRESTQDFMEHSIVRYELATSRDFDSLRLMTTYQKDTAKTESTLVLTTKNYNQPVEIAAPTGSIPLVEFLAQKLRDQQAQTNNEANQALLRCPNGIVNCTLDSAADIVDTTLTGVQGILESIFGPRNPR